VLLTIGSAIGSRGATANTPGRSNAVRLPVRLFWSAPQYPQKLAAGTAVWQCLQTTLGTPVGLDAAAGVVVIRVNLGQAYRGLSRSPCPRRGAETVRRHGAMNEGMGNDCRECLAGRPHCHGTLIHHWGQPVQCTEPGCDHPEVLLHALRIDCEAVGCDCGRECDSRLRAV
jgi:hypothetical protein